MNLLDNTPNQPSKFKTKNWVEINNDSQGVHGIGSQIKFNKTAILRLISYDYSNGNIFAKRTITVLNTAGTAADPDNRNKKVVFKKCAPCTDCIIEINNTDSDHIKAIGEVMRMYNLIEYCDNYSKTLDLYSNTAEMNQL